MGIRRIARVLVAATLLGGGAARATEPITFVEGIDGIPGLTGASGVVVSPDGAHVYVASFFDDTVVMFSRNAVTNALTSLGFLEDGVGGVEGLGGAARIAISPDGAHVYVASGEFGLGDHALAVFDRDAGTGLLTQTQVLEQGVGGVDGLTHPTNLVVAPDGGHVYVGRTPTEVPERGPAVFERDPGTGLLTFVAVTSDMPSFTMGLSPDGANLYAAGDLADLVVAARDADTGLLTPVQTISHEAISSFEAPGGIAVSGDGRHVYYSGLFERNAVFTVLDWGIAAFFRDAAAGTLIRDAVYRAGQGTDGGSLRLTSDGLVLVVGRPAGDGSASARDPATGAATRWHRSSSYYGSPFGGGALAMSPDDRGIYAARWEVGLRVYTLGPCRPLAMDTKLSFGDIGLDPDPSNDTFVMKGKGVLPGVAVPDLGLDVTGVRIVLDTLDSLGGGAVSDDVIPGGIFAGTGTAGWVRRKEGRLWLYVDQTASPVNGITKIKIQDRSSNQPGEIGIKIVAKRGGSYPVPAEPFDNAPPTVARIELGSPDRCLLTGAADCTSNPALTKTTCKSER